MSAYLKRATTPDPTQTQNYPFCTRVHHNKLSFDVKVCHFDTLLLKNYQIFGRFQSLKYFMIISDDNQIARKVVNSVSIRILLSLFPPTWGVFCVKANRDKDL